MSKFNDRNTILGWTNVTPSITVVSMFSTVPLRPARVSNIQTRIRLSRLFTFLLDITNWVYTQTLLYFGSIGSKDNLVQLSGAVRQAFPCALFRCNVTDSEKAHVSPPLNETFKRKAFKTRKKVVNKTYSYEFMMHLLTCRSLTLVLWKDQDEQATNA